MTPEQATNLGQEKVFLHIEARLAKALEETAKQYGEDIADAVSKLIRANLLKIMLSGLPAHKLLCAWMETVARWNEQIDELVRK